MLLESLGVSHSGMNGYGFGIKRFIWDTTFFQTLISA